MMYRVLLLVFLLSAIGSSPAMAQEDTRRHEDAWARVTALERDGLPRSAAAVADSIYGLARASGDMPQQIRALLHRVRYTSSLEEQSADSVVADLRQAIGEAPAPARALLHSILAELYTQYYRQHRRQIWNRTAVTTIREDDMRTWDSRTFIREAMRHYLASVEPSDTLQSVPVDAFEAVLVEAPESRPLRPTLYDFLVHRAIDFFERGEAGLLAPERALMLEGSEVFAPAPAFIRLETADDDSPDARALRLLQALLAFPARAASGGRRTLIRPTPGHAAAAILRRARSHSREGPPASASRGGRTRMFCRSPWR